MIIREWMTTNVISVTPETSMLKASRLMKDHNIRRLPVVDEAQKVVGMVSDRDIRDASPSKASTLDAHELYYLLSELKVSNIMTRDVVTVPPTETVEHVTQIMETRGFGALPVVDEARHLVGIITDQDIYRVLLSITGARIPSIQFAFSVDDKSGAMLPMIDAIHRHNGNIVSVLTAINGPGEQSQIYIRIRPLEPAAEDALVNDLKTSFPDNFDYWVKDKLQA